MPRKLKTCATEAPPAPISTEILDQFVRQGPLTPPAPDGHIWEEARDAGLGDDFSEPIPIGGVEAILVLGRGFKVRLGRRSLNLLAA